MKRIGLLWRTVRHLTPRQALYQVINRLRGPGRPRLPETAPTAYFLTVPGADKPASYQAGTFTFLNQSVSFQDAAATEIDWNHADNGKLWTYNLNYFDFLNQSDMTAEAGLALILNFIAQTDILNDGLESYPTSLRLINWVHFLSRHRIRNDAVNAHLFAQTILLSRRLEYHLAGNHLLENGFALLIGSLYFRQTHWFRSASALVRAELTTQILADGCYNERSPVYHQILLDRLLDVLLALRHDDWHKDLNLIDFLTDKTQQMLNWLEAVTFRNGDVPMVNDAAWGMAPTTTQLRAKAGATWCCDVARTPTSGSALAGIPDVGVRATASGYWLFRPPRYELFVDAGLLGPDHQPGHGHADTLSFVLYVDNFPVLVDSGTSTYQTGPRRTWERSTAAHNTVTVGGQNSSEVWAGFRVGRRARTTIQESTETTLTASHDGYRRLGIRHQRTWSAKPAEICILDRLMAAKSATGIARFYFHPDVPVTLTESGVLAGPLRLSFSSDTIPELRVLNCEIATGFNRLQRGKCLEITFTDWLETNLIPTE